MSQRLNFKNRAVKAVAIAFSPVLFGIAACTQEPRSNRPESTPASTTESPLPTVPPAAPTTYPADTSVYEKYEFASPLCSEEADPLTNIDFPESIERVKKIKFLENNPERLYNAVNAIRQSDDLYLAYVTAQVYLENLGITVNFYGPDQFGFVDAPNGKKFTSYYSQQWQVEDEVKINAVANFVQSIAILPKQFFDKIDNANFYIPESVFDSAEGIHWGGYAGYPDPTMTGKYYIALGLDEFITPNVEALFHELLGHVLHYRICGISAPSRDLMFETIREGQSLSAPFTFSSDYAKENMGEDFAELPVDFFAYSLSPPNTPRGKGLVTEKLKFFVHRLSEAIEMPPEDLLAIANVYAAYGRSRHPLASLSSPLAAGDNSGWTPFEPVDPDNPVFFLDTPEGKLALRCALDQSPNFIECRLSVHRVIHGESDSTWWNDYVRYARDFDLPIGGATAGLSTAYTPPNANQIMDAQADIFLSIER